MAVERVLFGTHQGDAVAGCALNDSTKPFLEVRRLRHLFVIGDAVAKQPSVPRTTSKLLPQEDILDAVKLQLVLQGFAVEVGQVVRVRSAAYVSNCGYPSLR